MVLMNVIKKIAYGTLAASTVVAFGCHFLNSPKLDKIKSAAIVIGLGAAMVYGYLDGVNPRLSLGAAAGQPAPRNAVQHVAAAQLAVVTPQETPYVQKVLDTAPVFERYRIGKGTPYPGTNLTAVTVRPANLFFQALLGANPSTLPGSNQLFAFRHSHDQIRNHILGMNPNNVVSFSATGRQGTIKANGVPERSIPNLGALYGNATYRMSFGELQATLNSQKIYACPLLPLPFYKALKKAMTQDNIVTLPGNDLAPQTLLQMSTPNCRALIAQVRKRHSDYGFASKADSDRLLQLSLYQVGALVVKTEDFRIFTDANGRIRERHPGEKDAIRLINACGIRGVRATPSPLNRTIMQQTFSTALRSAESGFVVMPATGMGVWGGDPDLYWRAFFDAVTVAGTGLEKIFVNPGHQVTQSGTFQGCNGNEFQHIFNEYYANARATNNVKALKNLDKITNLYDRKTDLLHLSHQLRVAFPEKIVSLFNASDPDVTLGNHVGEYVNALDQPATTEENYTALSTMGLCFEGITGVHADPTRLKQM
jgi:hypothetical protein